jgi:hypothetical protein
MEQLNDTTPILGIREICYPWHPSHGQAVCVHAVLVKRGQAVAYCSLEDLQTRRQAPLNRGGHVNDAMEAIDSIHVWHCGYTQEGLAGLDGKHQGSRPRVVSPAVQARLLRKTLQKPEDGSTHWSCRKMAAALNLSKSTVQRIWSQTRLKPHRLDRYMASNDPKL